MPLNHHLVGKSYPARSFAVEEERASMFTAAVGDDDALVSPTFPTAAEFLALAQLTDDPDLGLDFIRVVHTEQVYEWHRPLVVGDVLSVAPRITGVRAKGGHEFLAVETEMRDPDGELVVLARMTLLSRGTA